MESALAQVDSVRIEQVLKNWLVGLNCHTFSVTSVVEEKIVFSFRYPLL